MNNNKIKKGFTLIELLILILILIILTIAMVLIINPGNMLSRARDSRRLAELSSINKAVQIAEAQGGIPLGSSTVVYVSIPDAVSSECSSLGLPILPGGWTYHCATPNNYRKTDGTGWIPVDFNSLKTGAPFGALPVDPVNTTSTGLYYTYTYDNGSWAATTLFESATYQEKYAATQNTSSTTVYTTGNSPSLTPPILLARGGKLSWACGDILTDSRDNKTYATVLIGSQCWMKQNINIGTRIAGTSNQTDNGIIEKYCYSDSDTNCDSNNNPNYPDGGLYQWAEAIQYAASCNGTGAPPNDKCSTPVQGICPSGWHIPSHYELTTLEKNVGSNPGAFPYNETTTGWLGTDEGTNLKPNGLSGFESNLAGYRTFVGLFEGRGMYAEIWSSLESGSYAWIRHLHSGFATVSRGTYNKLFYGFLVRCVQD